MTVQCHVVLVITLLRVVFCRVYMCTVSGHNARISDRTVTGKQFNWCNSPCMSWALCGAVGPDLLSLPRCAATIRVHFHVYINHCRG